MERKLRDNNYYENIMTNFTFANTEYRAQVTFAYFNSCLDEILQKYDIEYDESWMLKDAMTAKNYKKYMDFIVRKLYKAEYRIDFCQNVIMDILILFNKMINLFDSGKRISHDISLLEISLAMEKDPEMYKLFSETHIHPDMTPEELSDKKDEILKKLSVMEVPGISELLRSGSGIKSDQLINMFFGLFMRVKPGEFLNEIYPRQVPERWVDGLKSRDSLFIEHSIQRLADILNNQTMKKSGVHNKDASILAQDCEIIELDCGSQNYKKYTIEDEKDLKSIEFKYRLDEKTGKLVECTLEDKHLIGTTVQVRSAEMCACKDGLCATCFGANAKWNLSTPEYRFDVGFVAARKKNSSISQKVLSVKHSSTPILVRVKFYIIDLDTGEIVLDGVEKGEEFFDRKWNKILFKEGVDIFIEVKDILKHNPKKGIKNGTYNNIAYKDAEFGEYDIIRCNKLYFIKDGKNYEMTANSPFRISGFPGNDTKKFHDTDRIKLGINNEITYVIRNNEHVMDFKKLQGVYNLSTDDIIKEAKELYPDEESPDMLNNQVEYMYNSIKNVVKGKNVTVTECALRNKIRAVDNDRVAPDWTLPVVPYQILSSNKAIGKKNSLSVILPKGHAYRRLTDATFHDTKNLKYSVFDLLYQNDEG